ncbi:hypothetical protein [Prosthecobacter sp.]|uniref:hypothetical protein n=1 Tax=Prosthecobacter sp. TaxID=1965333 RepID=UPI0037838EFE
MGTATSVNLLQNSNMEFLHCWMRRRAGNVYRMRWDDAPACTLGSRPSAGDQGMQAQSCPRHCCLTQKITQHCVKRAVHPLEQLRRRPTSPGSKQCRPL